MNWTRSKVLPLIALAFIALSAYPICLFVRRININRNYELVQIGDSKQAVIALFGQPNKITPCSHPKDESEQQRKCSQEFVYSSFIELWILFFDKDGK